MQQPKDWSKFKIMESLYNRGYTGVKLSKTFGFDRTAVSKVISGTKWSTIEQLISDVIGVRKEIIFAGRYSQLNKISNLCIHSNKKTSKLQVKNDVKNIRGLVENQKVA
ncbi:MAG: hypothetical protein GY793_04675 [Proteobacteria bacterium]|nr:hypothetical protein [Pseudomonadota bacterium]